MDIYAVCSGFNILENNWRVFYSLWPRKIVKKNKNWNRSRSPKNVCIFGAARWWSCFRAWAMGGFPAIALSDLHSRKATLFRMECLLLRKWWVGQDRSDLPSEKHVSHKLVSHENIHLMVSWRSWALYTNDSRAFRKTGFPQSHQYSTSCPCNRTSTCKSQSPGLHSICFLARSSPRCFLDRRTFLCILQRNRPKRFYKNEFLRSLHLFKLSRWINSALFDRAVSDLEPKMMK